jgi:hypothetical protein
MLRLVDVAGGALMPGLTVYGPTGSLVDWHWSANVAGVAFAALSTGTYTVVVHDQSSGLAATGAYNLYYTKAPGANEGGALSSGSAVIAHIDKGDLDSYTFTAATGNGITLAVTDLQGGPLAPGITIYGPSGNAVASTWHPSQAIRSFAAPSTGTYTVVVYDASTGWASTGDYRLDYTWTP